MKKITFYIATLLIVTLVSAGIFVACRNSSDKNEQTIIKGKIKILVDESVYPIVEDEAAVFESQYDAKLELISKPENEAVNMLLSHEADVAVLTRQLTKDEFQSFKKRGISTKPSEFAIDAIALITEKSSNDTIVDLQQIINLLQGKSSAIKGLVFDNPNSGTVRYMNDLAQVKTRENKNVYSMKSTADALKYISENPGLIGVVGLSSILEPTPDCEKYIAKINVMGVRDVKNTQSDKKYYKPNQSNIGAGLYPLTRTVYLLNYQGKAGLGTGFATYICGEDGQRIILKSGLLPIKMPTRIVNIPSRKSNNNKN